MAFFSAVREIAEGFKLGTRYAFTESHGFVEKGVQPRIANVGPESFGR